MSRAIAVEPPIQQFRIRILSVLACAVAVVVLSTPAAFALGVRVDSAPAVSAGVPDISGTRIVWNQRNVNVAGAHIHTLDLATGVRQPLPNVHDAGIPSVWGDRIVWTEYQYQSPVSISLAFGMGVDGEPWSWSDGDIFGAFATDVNGKWTSLTSSSNWAYLYDTSVFPALRYTMAPGTVFNSGDNAVGVQQLEITNKYVYWADTRNSGDSDIYFAPLVLNNLGQLLLYNADQTAGAANEFEPAGDGDWCVYTDDRNGNYDIYAVNVVTHEERAIATGAGNQRYPDISGNYVIWTDYATGNGDLYMYDLATRESARVTSDANIQRHPAIYGTKIVWEDSSPTYGTHVYYLDLAADATPPRTTSDARSTYVGNATVRLRAVDSGGSGVAATYYKLDSRSPVAGTTVRTSVPGAHTLSFWSVDAAGNTESRRVARFSVTKPYVVLGTPVAPKTMKRSKKYSVYGSLKPKHTAGTKPVRIYKQKRVKVSGKLVWRPAGYVNATAYNYLGYTRYKAKMRLTSKGKWRLRARAPEDSRHATTLSPKYDYVTVK